ncbi:hypothetical protein H5410_040847 [Solanum commersonii]|uniref:Uncharacterized protein n=1 Tax=Solanum commersonii TaxID=4109 RepID=A0A9J5XRB6_SOLCO|nr:hypothetical protein H5410_040847 [Solanum commersonii]
MIAFRDLVEHHILWKIGKGNARFWFCNTTLGALYHIIPDPIEEEVEVRYFSNDEGWDLDKSREHLLQEYVQHVLKTISYLDENKSLDQRKWILKPMENS